MFKDIVRIADHGVATLRSKLGKVISRRELSDSHRSVVEIHGWVKLLMRERGKIVPGSHREGHNVWTNTGREYLPLLMSYSDLGPVKYRDDRIAYIAVGTGFQVEDAGVLKLASPVVYSGGSYLAPFETPPTFPLTPTRTTVRYKRTFLETEITTSPGQVDISEIGMFTDGDPDSNYTPGTRVLTVGNQAPAAYKSFEPVGKTDSLELEVNWEIRF